MKNNKKREAFNMQIPALLLDNFALAQTALCLVKDKAEAIRQKKKKCNKDSNRMELKPTLRLLCGPTGGIPAAVATKKLLVWFGCRRKEKKWCRKYFPKNKFSFGREAIGGWELNSSPGLPLFLLERDTES